MKRGLDGPAPEERPSPAGRRNKQDIRIDPEVEATYEPRRTVISALVEHEPGVLSGRLRTVLAAAVQHRA